MIKTEKPLRRLALPWGQSMFEYIVLVAGVVVVLIIFLNPYGPFRFTVENILNGTTEQINGLLNMTVPP